ALDDAKGRRIAVDVCTRDAHGNRAGDEVSLVADNDLRRVWQRLHPGERERSPVAGPACQRQPRIGECAAAKEADTARTPSVGRARVAAEDAPAEAERQASPCEPHALDHPPDPAAGEGAEPLPARGETRGRGRRDDGHAPGYDRRRVVTAGGRGERERCEE